MLPRTSTFKVVGLIGMAAAGIHFTTDATIAQEKTAPGTAATGNPGMRPLIPGRTLLIVSTDGSPPATVDGEEITWTEFNGVLGRSAQARFYHAKVPEGGEAALRAETIEKMIVDHLLIEEARRRKIEADQDWVDGEIQKLELRYKGSATWQNQREAVIPKIKRELVKQSILKLLEKRVRQVEAPTMEQLREFFNSQPTMFTEPAKDKVSVILLGVDPSSRHIVWEKAREEGGRILKKIKAGGDFAEIANLRSTDTSAEQGGDLGYLHRGMLSAEGQKVVDELKPGEVSNPVRILQGYAIFKLHERKPPRSVTFKEARNRLQPLYTRVTGEKQWTALQEELRSKAVVTVNPILVRSENGVLVGSETKAKSN